MPADASIILGIKPPVIQSPLATVGALANLRDVQSQTQLRDAQTASAFAQQRDVEAQAQQRNRDLADDNTIQEIERDPDSYGKIFAGDYLPLAGKVQDHKLAAVRTNVNAAIAGKATATKDQLANELAASSRIGDAVQSLATLRGVDGTLDLSRVNAALPGVVGGLHTDLGVVGVDPAKLPTSITDEDQLDSMAAYMKSHAAFVGAAQKYKADQQKIVTDAAAAGKDTAQGNQAQAEADKVKALTPAERAKAQAEADQAARVLAGTSGTGITAEQAAQNQNAAGELGVKQGELGLKKKTFDATLGSGLDANGQPLAPEALKATALQNPNALAIAEYRAVPPAETLRNGSPNPIYRLVNAINPAYDAKLYAERNKVQQAFSAAGPQGLAITSADTALSHLSAISEAGKALKSNDIQLLNRVANFVGAQAGSAAPAVYDSIVATVAPEISKTVIGATGGEGERQQMAANFSRNFSDSQRESAIAATVGLLSARVKKQADAYESSMGHPLGRQLSPESQEVMKRYSGAPAPAGGGVAPIRLKDGRTLTPGSQAQADAFRKDHPELIQ